MSATSDIDEEDLKDVTLIGHSMGGLVGTMVAARHPAAIDRLMVVDIPAYFGDTQSGPLEGATVCDRVDAGERGCRCVWRRSAIVRSGRQSDQSDRASKGVHQPVRSCQSAGETYTRFLVSVEEALSTLAILKKHSDPAHDKYQADKRPRCLSHSSRL